MIIINVTSGLRDPLKKAGLRGGWLTWLDEGFLCVFCFMSNSVCSALLSVLAFSDEGVESDGQLESELFDCSESVLDESTEDADEAATRPATPRA